jgi:hypothetical protein
MIFDIGLPTSVERVVRQAVLSWFCVDVKLCDEALCQGTSGINESNKSFASCPLEKNGRIMPLRMEIGVNFFLEWRSGILSELCVGSKQQGV